MLGKDEKSGVVVTETAVATPDNEPEVEPSSLESQQHEVEEEPWAPKQLPLVWEFWSIFPVAFIYAMAKAYILVEPLLGLRSMQVGAFATVDWMSLLPHLG